MDTIHSTTMKTACTRDCPDACGLVATIRQGRVVRLQGDPDHPVTRGFLCYRTSRFLERQYSPDRLTRPLLRRAKSGDFMEIGWPDALDLVAEKMRRLRQESGPASIMQYRCGGSLGIMKHVGDYFFQRFGPVTIKSGDICSGAGEAAQQTDFGLSESSDFFDLHNARTIVLWGKNVFVSNVHLIPQLKQAQRNGSQIILIDPVYHRTASMADMYLQPRAGTDAAIALGAARWLIENHRADPNAADYCDHLDAYRALVFGHALDTWAAYAEIPESALVDFADAYSHGPSSILIGWGLQRRTHGATTIRAIDALATISGNMGIPGGGASFYFRRRSAFDLSFHRPDLAPRRIPEPLFGPEVIAAKDPPIRMLFIWSANPVAMLPDSNTVAQAIASREFSVVVDPFFSDTARCADLVLPTTTMLEEDDLVGSYGHHYVADVRPVTAPPDGVLSDYDIIRELATRLGLADEFSVDTSVWKQRLLGKLSDYGIDAGALQAGAIRNLMVPQIAFADRKFLTPTGKANLLHALPADWNPRTHPTGLRLAALSTEKSQGSQWPPAAQHGIAVAVVHPEAVPGYHNGARVTLKSQWGSMQVQLALDARQRRDIVLMEKGGWHFAGRCANALVGAQLTDEGQCAVLYDTLVEIV